MPTKYQQYRQAITILSQMNSTPSELKNKYPVESTDIAALCGVSLSRVYRWKEKVPKTHQITLGICDFLLEDIDTTFPLLTQWQSNNSNQ